MKNLKQLKTQVFATCGKYAGNTQNHQNLKRTAKNRQLLIASISIMILASTACASNSTNNVPINTTENNVNDSQNETFDPVEELSEIEEIKDNGENKNSSSVFSRNLDRTIPDGFIEAEWENEWKLEDETRSETPLEITAEYTMIENPNTGMIGLSDYEGNILIEAEYSELSFIEMIDDILYFTAKYEGNFGVINSKGEITVPFNKEYIVQGSDVAGTRLLQFLRGDQFVTCITYDIVKGEIGRFDIPYNSEFIYAAEVVADMTRLGPNDWVLPVSYDSEGQDVYLGIWDCQGNQLSEEKIIWGGALYEERNYTTTKEGYSVQPYGIEYTESLDDVIYDPQGNIIAGPYNSISQKDDLFICREENGNTIYDPTIDKYYEPLDANILKILNKNLVVYEKDGTIATLDLATGETTQIRQDTPSDVRFYGEILVYQSNDTYKVSDLQGNDVGNERYYGIQNACDGVLLKLENGDWVYLNENGELSKTTNMFHGDGEVATTYNNCPIVGIWKYDGVPCVVVEEDGKQVGYAL